MTPHDVKGCEFKIQDLVATGTEQRQILLGIVREINTTTGCVTVATADLSRRPVVEVEKFAFPADQLVIVRGNLNPNSPLYPILRNICTRIRLDNSGLCEGEAKEQTSKEQ